MLAASRATQLLAEFLAVVSSLPDAESALAAGVEGAALALEAQVAAVVCGGRARTSIGYPADDVPHEELAEVAAGARQLLVVPTTHRLARAIAVPVGSLDGHLVVARVGDEPFSTEEVDLARGMARVMDMTFQMLRTLDSERRLRDHSERQAAENAALLVSLRARQRLSEELSAIQRAISRRDPLADILDSVTRGVRDLLGDDIAVLRQARRRCRPSTRRPSPGYRPNTKSCLRPAVLTSSRTGSPPCPCRITSPRAGPCARTRACITTPSPLDRRECRAHRGG